MRFLPLSKKYVHSFLCTDSIWEYIHILWTPGIRIWRQFYQFCDLSRSRQIETTETREACIYSALIFQCLNIFCSWKPLSNYSRDCAFNKARNKTEVGLAYFELLLLAVLWQPTVKFAHELLSGLP